MRNLALQATSATTAPNANLCATALDLDTGALYLASARLTPDAELTLEIWCAAVGTVRAGPSSPAGRS
jgi:hypothetical protein